MNGHELSLNLSCFYCPYQTSSLNPEIQNDEEVCLICFLNLYGKYVGSERKAFILYFIKLQKYGGNF